MTHDNVKQILARKKWLKPYFPKSRIKTGYEIHLQPAGKRMDFVAVVDSEVIIGVEIKTGIGDLRQDSKIHYYLEFCHFFCLAVTQELLPTAQQKLNSLPDYVGLIIITEQNKAVFHKHATRREISDYYKSEVLRRMLSR